MLKVYEYSHLGGSEILQARFPEINAAIDRVIAAVKVPAKTKVSRERTNAGTLLYAPTEMNATFKAAFRNEQLHELKDRYTITIPDWNTQIRGAFKQVDFARGPVLVEVQFGKYAFMFYDLAKFQYFSTKRRQMSG